MDRPTGITVLLQAIVERSTLDTFDLWTRYEALPRLRRTSLLGDTTAVARSSGVRPGYTPSAITVVEGDDGYSAMVWISSLGESVRPRSLVSLVVDDPTRHEGAARDLARFVEFTLVDTMELALAGCGVCECIGDPAPPACPRRSRARLPSTTVGYRSPMNDERLAPATADRMPTADEEQAAERAAADVDLEQVAAHEQEMAETGANVRGEGQIEPDA